MSSLKFRIWSIKLRLLEKIGELAKEKRVEGISDLNDASAGDDIKIIIDIKKDYNANVILNQLYKYTSLQESFGANMLALVDGKPVVLNLQQMLAEYLKHQEMLLPEEHALIWIRRKKERIFWRVCGLRLTTLTR